jgi:hypothetical protein
MKFKTLSLLSVIGILLFPDTATAQGILDGVCSGIECSGCDIAVIANSFISWLIGAVMVLFAVLMVIAGFGLVTSGGNPDALNTAKSKFTNAIIGLIIVLSAWLIVDTLMKALVGDSGQVSGNLAWSEIQCMTQVEATTVPETVQIDITSAGNDGFIGPGPGGFAGEVNAISASGNCFPGPNGVFDGGPMQGGDDVCLSGYQVSGADYNLADGSEHGYVAPVSYFGPDAIARNPQLTTNLRLCDVTSCELDRRRGDYVALDPSMVANLDLIYQDLGGIQVNSGYRSPSYNESVGGVTHSRHQYGDAVDIAVTRTNTEARIIESCRSRGASEWFTYDSGAHVHCDWR